MIPRRQLLGLAVLGGTVGTADTGAGAAAAEPQLTERSLDTVARAIEQSTAATQRSLTGLADAVREVRQELQTERSFAELRPIRDVQREYLLINQKMPDYIDVGINVWMAVHDWHIRWQQPLSMGRDAANRYTIVLFQTVLIMRTDQLPNYVGLPYDNRPQ